MVGTVESLLMARKRNDEFRDLGDHERDMLGRSVRIDLPISDLPEHKIRELADQLRGVANSLEFIAQRNDLDLYHKLQEVRRSVMKLKYFVSSATGRYKWLGKKQ